MYDSTKHTFRKLTVFAIAGVLAVSCLAGCKKDENPENETTTAPSGTSSIETTIPTSTDPTDVSLNRKGTVLSEELNVREGVGTKYKVVGTLKRDDEVTIHKIEDLNGTEWGLTDDGWVCLVYVQIEGEPPKILPAESAYEITDPITGVVIATELNIRKGPGIGYESVRCAKKGEDLTVIELKGNWGRTEEGWFNTIFAYFEGTIDAVPVKGTVTADELNVRTGPSIAYDSILKLVNGTEVEAIKLVTVNNSTWGYIGDGWINMAYIETN